MGEDLTEDLVLWLKADDGLDIVNPTKCQTSPNHCFIRRWADQSMNAVKYDFVPPKIEKLEVSLSCNVIYIS